MKYKVKLLAKKGSTKVDVFVAEPNIRELKKKLSIPHLYPDGSLCLYYPDYNEWSAEDLWADTLIPWTASPQTWVLAMKNPRILRGLRFYRNDQDH